MTDREALDIVIEAAACIAAAPDRYNIKTKQTLTLYEALMQVVQLAFIGQHVKEQRGEEQAKKGDA